MTDARLRISYVEDEPDIREVTSIALSEIAGFALDVCASPHEALERIPAYAPDAMLLDVMMPAMTGPELLIRLRERPELAQTPAIFITAKAQSHEIREYLDMGAAGVIRKPYDPMALGDLILDIVHSANASSSAGAPA